jgi:hypothetical protein
MFGLILYFTLESFGVAAAGFALWKGGPSERLAAGVVIVNVIITQGIQWLLHDGQDLARLGNDGVSALVLLLITIRYGALWMGGAMLFYAAQFALHSYYIVAARSHDNLHAWINNINWQGIVWCLVIGTAVAWRQRTRAARRLAQAAP